MKNVVVKTDSYEQPDGRWVWLGTVFCEGAATDIRGAGATAEECDEQIVAEIERITGESVAQRTVIERLFFG